MSESKDDINITEEEAKIYDRQIRLWGLDAQKRLREAKVLLVGINGLTTEVAKNIVLAGIKSLTLMDHRVVESDAPSANFLVPVNSAGKNVAEMSTERTQRLNPMVDVSFDTGKVSDKRDDFFRDFDVICVSDASVQDLMRLNNIVRENKAKLYAADTYGYFGYIFADLGEHQFAEEVITAKPSRDEESSVTKSHSEDSEPKTVKKSLDYPSLQNALDVDWKEERNQKRLKRMTPLYIVTKVLLEFQIRHARKPQASSFSSDVEDLIRIKNEIINVCDISAGKVPDDIFKSLFGEVCPTCAVVGGVLAQDIIKAVSQKDAPIYNFFFFNAALDGAGIVDYFGP